MLNCAASVCPKQRHVDDGSETHCNVNFCEILAMIRCGNRIRLHKEGADWLYQLTGTAPNGIRSVDDLNRFIDQHLPVYDGITPESQLLRMLLADKKINLEID